MSNSKHQAIVHFNNGGKLLKSKLYSDALEQYQKAFECDPTLYDVHFSIARTLIYLTRTREGITYFQKYAGLIPKGKQGRYAIGLSDTLIDQGKHIEALDLLESLDITYDDDQTLKLLPLFVVNNRIKETVYRLINISSETDAIPRYEELLTNGQMPKETIDKLNKDNIVPRYFNSLKRLEIIKAIHLANDTYREAVKLVIEDLTNVRINRGCDYLLELDRIDKSILNLQNSLFNYAQNLIKKKKTLSASTILSDLKKLGFDETKIESTNKEIKRINISTKKRVAGKTLIVSFIVIGVVIAGFFTYRYFEKESAHKYALSSGTINAYSNFLHKYGDDKEIHTLRERKLYDNALKSNLSVDISKLTQLYPESKFLRSIEISTKEPKIFLSAFGIGSIHIYLEDKNDKTFLAPIGCKVGYRLSAGDKLTIEKIFTVSENIKLTEEFREAKTLIFEDSFKNNRNGWTTSNNSKTIYGRVKNKGVKLTEGSLNFFHEYSDNKFLLSTIYLSKLQRSDDFEIRADIQRNGPDNGTFILFGATKRAFNYLGFAKSGNMSFGYNNWDGSNESWINQSNGWKLNNSLSRNNNGNNKIVITKKAGVVKYSVNGSYFGEMPLKKWYGRRIGFGINGNTNSKIQNLEISILNRPLKTDFQINNVYYCWVDELNVRDNGTIKGDILTTISRGEPVKYLGEIGAKEVRATFKGVFRPDYYYKFELVDGTVGWIHGGALRGLKTTTPIDFSKFKSTSLTEGNNIQV